MPSRAALAYTGKCILLGLLASASGAVVALLGLLLMLGVVEGWSAVHELLSGTTRAVAGRVVMQDLARVPGFLWGWRWFFLALIAVGLPLGGVDGWAQHVDRPWNRQITLVALLWLVGTGVVTYLWVVSSSFRGDQVY